MEFFPTKDENKINESSKHRKEMKKNILKATLVAAFGLIAGFNVYNSQKSDVMSELALANVEALADDAESGEDLLMEQIVLLYGKIILVEEKMASYILIQYPRRIANKDSNPL